MLQSFKYRGKQGHKFINLESLFCQDRFLKRSQNPPRFVKLGSRAWLLSLFNMVQIKNANACNTRLANRNDNDKICSVRRWDATGPEPPLVPTRNTSVSGLPTAPSIFGASARLTKWKRSCRPEATRLPLSLWLGSPLEMGSQLVIKTRLLWSGLTFELLK